MMGASLADALRKTPSFSGKILGAVRSQASADFIRSHGVCDEIHVVASHEAALERLSKLPDSSLIVIGLPVRSAVEFTSGLAGLPHLVTDMSSTRRAIERSAGKVRFVGSHPICGSEDTGPQALRVGLFENRLCIITPLQSSLPQDVTDISTFWKSIGMNVMTMDAEEHDTILAYLSHAPHFISGLMATWGMSLPVKNAIDKSPAPLTGGGFRDMVRIAGSNPEMWIDILETNGDQIKAVMQEFHKDLGALLSGWDARSESEWLVWLKEARKRRNKLSGFPENQ